MSNVTPIRPAAKEDDPLAGHDNGYSLAEFYMRATDGQGHKDVVHTPFPPHILSSMQAIVNQRTFPYRSVQDLVRDAVHHRLHWLLEQAPNRDLDQSLIIEEGLAYNAAVRQRMETNTRLVAEASDSLREAARMGAYDEVASLIEKNEALIETLTEPWKGHLESLLTEYRRELGRFKK